MTTPDAGILRAAEADREHAMHLLEAHKRDCRHKDCDDCWTLARHVTRTVRQVELLTPAEPEMQELF